MSRSKLNMGPARGMRDFLPAAVRRREYVINIVRRVYESYGFEPLETPAVENIETLLGKYGEEGNQLIFKILKRGEHEASGQADLALRYDLTVPLARVVAEHSAELPRLFRRYQIQPVWRADRPARGRFREFYQCDVDALGSTSPAIEAELCGAVSEVLTALGFADFHIRLNHRQLLSAILRRVGVRPENEASTLVVLDKLDKIGQDGVVKELLEKGLLDSMEQQDALLESKGVRHFLSWLMGSATREGIAEWLSGDAAGLAALANLSEIMALAEATPAKGRVTLDRTLARGLSYYTGAIMEIAVPDLAGSLGGGGRYDGLVGMFSGEQVPACGFSLGLERILVLMGERGLFPPEVVAPQVHLMVCVPRLGDSEPEVRLRAMQYAAGFAAEARSQAEANVFLYPDVDKLDKQIKYAATCGIRMLAICGPDEIGMKQVSLKTLNLGGDKNVGGEKTDFGAAGSAAPGGRLPWEQALKVIGESVRSGRG